MSVVERTATRGLETAPAEKRGFLAEGIGRKVSGATLAVFRMLIGILWIGSATWKVPPDFGRATNTGLWYWLNEMIRYPTFDWHARFLESFGVSNFTLLGYSVLFGELTIGF